MNIKSLCIKIYSFFFLHIFRDNTIRHSHKNMYILQSYRIDTLPMKILNKEAFRGLISVNVQFKIN